MIISPIQNGAYHIMRWYQKRSREFISQRYGKNASYYQAKLGLKSHNGIDYAVPVGTPVFAPMEGKVTIKKQKYGYGWHIKIKTATKEVVLAHLSKFLVKDGQWVNLGQEIAHTGNTGLSTGPHLHFGFRHLKNGKVINYDNGNLGYVNPEKLIIEWKGTHNINNL